MESLETPPQRIVAVKGNVMALNGTKRMRTRPISLLATVAFVLGTVFFGTVLVGGVALAQSAAFGLRPLEAGRAYFEHTIAPGAAVEDVLVVNNPGDAAQRIEVWVARGATMAAGGITFSEEADGPAAWVSLPAAGIVEVAAQSAVNLPFTVAVPVGTAPGEYVVGLLATQSISDAATPVTTEITNTGTSGFQVVVVSRVAVALIITVPEANRCEALISGVTSTSSNGRWHLDIGMQNTGNVHFKGTGELIARQVGNDEIVAQSAFEVGYFIPGDTIEYPLNLEPYPAAGDYELGVTLLTDCGFTANFTQPLNISGESVAAAAAEAQAQLPPAVVSDEAATLLAQAELMRSIGMLVGGVAALLLVAAVVIYMMRKRKVAEVHSS